MYCHQQFSASDTSAPTSTTYTIHYAELCDKTSDRALTWLQAKFSHNPEHGKVIWSVYLRLCDFIFRPRIVRVGGR